MLKTRLNTFGKDFGHFEKKVFQFFLSFSKFRPSRVHWALFFREKAQNKFKTCLDTFGNVFGYLEFWEVLAFFWNFSTSLPSRVHWPKKFEKITSKHVWTILETFLDIFENLKFFSISVELFWVSRVQWAESFSVETIKQNMLKQCFWERSWRILKVSKFFHLFVFFASFDHPGCTGQKFLPKNYLEACWKHVWTLLGTFLGILNNWKFFQFFEVFPSVDPTGCTGHFFPRKLPENKFKTCVETFKIIFGHFWVFIFFRFILPSFTNFDLQVALGKKNSKKLPQASLDTFDDVFRDFEFLKSFRFLWIFLSLQGSLGRAFFRRNNQAKHAQTMFLGTFLDNFESFEVFPLFCAFCKFRPSRVHWAKNFAKKMPRSMLKTCLIAFGNVFLGILNNWKFFQFFDLFPSLDPPGCTEQKISIKSPQNLFGHS